MTIKTRIRTSFVVVVALLLSVGLVGFQLVQQSRRAIASNEKTTQILKGVFELNVLTNDYLLHRGQRAKTQWYSKHGTLGEILRPEMFSGEEKEHAERLYESHERTTELFSQMVTNHEQQELGEENGASKELEATLLGQLSVELQAMASTVLQLSSASYSKIVSTGEAAQQFILVTFLIIIVSQGVLLFLLNKSIGEPLAKLQRGAETIGSGSLGYRIDIKSKDEIGLLAVAFNKMVGNLSKEITEHEKTEWALKERMKELRLIYETSRIMIGNTDLNKALKEIVKITPSAYQFPELACARIIFDGEEFKTENFRETRWGQSAKIQVGDKKTGLIEAFYLEEKPFLAEEKAMLDEVAAQISNITKRRKVDEAIQEAALEKAKAAEAKAVVEKMKELDRMKDEFLDIAAHELRTPLTAIRGNSSMLLDYFADKLQDEQLREALTDIHEGGVRLAGVVDDFLDVSRLEGGRIKFNKKNFNLVALIQDVLNELKSLASQKSLSLRLINSPSRPFNSLGDEMRARQVIVNLVGNAIEFTEKGGVSIEVKKKDGFAEVNVSDTGIGISKEKQGLLFQKFQQAGENRLARDVTRGTGLGLYISKMLAEGMGGKVYLERSDLGKGSIFIFELPLAKAEAS